MENIQSNPQPHTEQNSFENTPFAHRHTRVDAVKGFAHEFKTFILKGNAVDLAIGVVIGTAFNEVVNSLVKDIILGAIATFAGKPDFGSFAYGAIHWGNFINTLINLIIVGLSVFVAIKVVNRLSKRHLVTTVPEEKK